LQIQSGASNLERPEYSAFEFGTNFYTGKFSTANATTSIQTSGGVQGNQFLRVSTTTAAAASCVIGDTATDYHVSVEAGKTYIISAWMKAATATAQSAYLRPRYSDGSFGSGGGATPSLPGSGAWARYSWAYTVPTGITNLVVQLFNNSTTAGAGVDIDGLMIEQQVGGLTTPSTYVMPGMTSADGGFLRTGQIVSNANVTVNGAQQPAWSINLSGGAQFGDAAIRGSLVVGPSTTTNLAPGSGNFESNVTGYTAYAVGGTGVALTRTTTVGELITGTGSMKVGWTTTPSKYGFSISLINGTVSPAGIPANNVVKIAMKVRGLNTGSSAGIDVYAEFLDGSNNVVYTTPNMLPTPTYLVPNTVMTINYNAVLPAGIANAASVRIVTTKTNTTPDSTGIIYDDVSVSASDDMGGSFISSGNYVVNDSGWKITSGGIAEFNNVIIRGGFESATSGLRWRIGTTPQWYGNTAEITAYNPSAGVTDSGKLLANPGGIYMYGAQAADVAGRPYISVSNQNFLDTAPNLYKGLLNMEASSIRITGTDGPAANGSKYGSQINIDANPDSAASPYNSASLHLRSVGIDGPASFVGSAQGEMYLLSDGGTGSTTSKLTLAVNGWFGGSAESSIILQRNSLSVNTATGLQSLTGNVMDQMMWQSRAVDMLTGGGVITVDTSYNIRWSQKFMIASLGRGANFYTNGYLAIDMPPVGTVINGYGGAPATTTVTSAGITMPVWGVLYYVPTFGTDGSTTDQTAWRMVGYSSDFTVPAHWIPIAIRNYDLNMVYFGNGIGYTPWYTPTFTNSWVAFGNASYQNPQYRRNSMGRVEMRGLMKSGTVNVQAFMLPAGFRPVNGEIFVTAASTGIADLRVFVSGEVRVAGYFAGGTNGSVSLSGVTFTAEN